MFEKVVIFEPAYDKRNPDPSKNYGIHGVNMRFVLKGELGSIHFCVFTNWHLPEVTEEYKYKPTWGNDWWKPTPADISYHSKTRLNEWDHEHENCTWLDGETCYTDGSSLYAEKPFEALIREGSEGLWKFLENYYNETFRLFDTTARKEQ